MRTRAKQKFVAKATAPGAKVPQAQLVVLRKDVYKRQYIDFVRQEAIEHPEKSWNKMIFGFQANKWRTRLLPKSGLSKGYQKLESMMMSLVADALAREDSYVSVSYTHL